MYRTTAVDKTISLCTGATYDNTSVVDQEPRSRNFIELPPGAGAEITNCGFGSFLFTTDLHIEKKIMIAEEVFVIYYLPYNINPITSVVEP